ncbi:MAG TPA: NAD(+)/NADH kinase [Anaerolineales bacterium]|nr:NAD(+)/NADH kinase [Anaerolineales bacterium]
MNPTPPIPRRFAIAVHPKIPEGAALAAEISEFLAAEHRTAVHAVLQDEKLAFGLSQGEFDLMIALGGDGTMLRAGHLCAASQVPILGINIGRFGFLTEVQRGEWRPILERVLAGDYWIERRMMLRAEHRDRDGTHRDAWDVLNECVVGRGEIVRPVRLTTEIDGRYLTTYVADGIIVATPTGSTAYALAAGGPILPPTLRNILLVPVAPHLSVDRAIVLDEGSWVGVTVHTDHQAMLSVDGHPPHPMDDGDSVVVRAGEHSANFVRLQDPGYFYRNLTSRMNQNPTTGAER